MASHGTATTTAVGSTAGTYSGGGGGGGLGGPAMRPPAPTHVSEAAYEFLLSEMLHWVESECTLVTAKKGKESTTTTALGKKRGGGGSTAAAATTTTSQQDYAEQKEKEEEHRGDDAVVEEEEAAILSAERAAAKIERLGFNVGYRLCERLAQSRPINPTVAAAAASSSSSAAGGGGPGSPPDLSSSIQLEAVKFLCKEFWMELFRKQVDKLQTNHRGVFVLKDFELKWLRRLPPDDEMARVSAIKILAFPCGLIRGALSNLGIPAVVSCDFLADGRNVASCSFNIKIK